MKKIVTVLAVIVLMLSSMYFGVSQFVNRLIQDDIVDNISDMSYYQETITSTIEDLPAEIDRDALLATFENNEVLKNLSQTLLDNIFNDLYNNSQTLDSQGIKNELLSYSDVIYQEMNLPMSQEQFNSYYQSKINELDLDHIYQEAVTSLQQQEAIQPVVQVYHFSQLPFVYGALVLMIIATAFLIFISYQNKVIHKGLSVTYLLSGIGLFAIGFMIMMALSVIVSSSSSIQVLSIYSLYACALTYMAIGFVLLIVNAFLKRRANIARKYYEI